jgi:hypothetical protein
MTQDRQSRILSNIVSPYGLAIISYVLFLCACLIPPSIYTHYMNEPDLMFMDPATILFYTLCVASFIAGVWLVGRLFPSALIRRRIRTRISPVVFVITPLAIGIAATLISIILLIRQIPNIFVLLLAQQGGDLKEIMAFEVAGRFTLAPLLLTGVTWWAYWRYPSLGLRGWAKRLVIFSVFLSVLLLTASSIITVSRNLLMPIIVGLAILSMMSRAVRETITLRFILGSGVSIALCVCLLFIGLSFLRGTSSWDDQIHSVIGYTLASYNRLSAIVDGKIHFPFAGNGLYLSSAISHTRLLPFTWILAPPDPLVIWGSEFGAISSASLDANFIWPGAFGQIFSDLGWYSFPFVFAYGALYAIVWRWFKCGKALGVVLYPWFGFCILFWLGTNYLLDPPIEPLLLVGLLLACYETAFLQSGITPLQAALPR